METLPHDWLALASLVLILGMKHGFDADHLAAIDGLTRYNSRHHPAIARYCGTLFSLGHGGVVVLISLLVATLANHWAVPGWMDLFGNLVSILFLSLLGLVNLWAVLAADPHDMVAPVGFKGRFLGGLQRTRHPLLIAGVGAIFAISFDTISQAALFAFTATRYGGWEQALGLGLLFMLGMLLTDGLNGLWISRLIARADQVARIASRVMSLVVSGISLLVAAYGAARLLSPTLDAWGDGKELALGLGVGGVVALSFLVALRLSRPAVAED